MSELDAFERLHLDHVLEKTAEALALFRGSLLERGFTEESAERLCERWLELALGPLGDEDGD